jgi:16S rRNA (adenine1518-N6/adenine1519-N6)-dimethyltransferase
MRAKRCLGQHFLISEGVIERIEVDYELVLELQGRFPDGSVVLADASELDLDELALKAGRTPWLVAGNLPYNVGTKVSRRVLRSPGHVTAAVLMLQREVARKLCAHPGEEEYGALSAEFAPWWTREILFTVKPGAFRPQPKVTSAVCLFTPTPRPALPAHEMPLFGAFVSHAFAHPRKLLSATLAVEGRDAHFWCHAMEKLGLSAKARPGQVAPAEYVALYAAAERNGTGAKIGTAVKARSGS